MNDKNANLIYLIFVQENKVNEVDVCDGILLLRLFCLWEMRLKMRSSFLVEKGRKYSLLTMLPNLSETANG